jgi:CDP-diacylglycerol--glycerol-3-phosphate 3-phosphatidyltransferase
MPTVYDLKPRFQAALRPIAGTLVAAGVTANQITLTGLVVSGLGGLLIWVTDGHWTTLLLLPEILFIRMALNAIDGIMAREHGQASRLGMLLNEVADVAADALLYLPLVVIVSVSPVLLGLVVVGGIISEMVGAMAPQFGAERAYTGPFGKSDRAVFFGVLAILLAIGLGGAWVNVVLAFALAACTWTIVNRCRAALDGDA